MRRSTEAASDDRPLGNGEPVGVGREAQRIQRRRIIDAMVVEVCEGGFASASVSSVIARAKVARRTFCEIFDSLEDCFLAVLDDGARHASELIANALDRERSWLDGVRTALASLLEFFGAEPALAHVLLVEATAAGPWARERREQHVAAVTALIVERAPDLGRPRPLADAGAMASLLGILHTHIVTGSEDPPLTLLGPMMGLVTAPYLDRGRVSHEIARAEALARELLARGGEARTPDAGPQMPIPEPLLDPRARRARASLLYLAKHSGASNRQIAQAIGIVRDTHISTLLARLARMGLLVKCAGAPGGPNAWSLSPSGDAVARALARSAEGAQNLLDGGGRSGGRAVI